MASKLTASWSGYREPAIHAVPDDSSTENARSICGQTELAWVYPVPTQAESGIFDPDSPHSCKRCVSAIAKAEGGAS